MVVSKPALRPFVAPVPVRRRVVRIHAGATSLAVRTSTVALQRRFDATPAVEEMQGDFAFGTPTTLRAIASSADECGKFGATAMTCSVASTHRINDESPIQIELTRRALLKNARRTLERSTSTTRGASHERHQERYGWFVRHAVSVRRGGNLTVRATVRLHGRLRLRPAEPAHAAYRSAGQARAIL